MNIFTPCVLFLSVSIFSLQATPAYSQLELSLDDAIRLAQENDPWLDGSRLRQQALEAQSLAAGTLPDPEVTLGVANLPTDSFNFAQEPMTQLVVGVSQVFPRGQSRELRRRQLAETGEQQHWLRADRRAKVAVTVSQLWLEHYRYSETIRLIEADRGLFEHLADVAESAYSSALNRTSQQDVIRAQVELTRLDDRLSRLAQRRDEFSARLGEWLPEPLPVYTDTVQAPPETDASGAWHRSDWSESEMILALLAHPGLKSLDKTIQAEGTGVDLAQQKYRPQWGLNASYGYRQDDPAGMDRANFFSLGLSFDMPLFTGNRQDQEVQAAIARQEASKTDKALALRAMRAGLESAMATLKRLEQRKALFETRLLTEIHDQAEAALNAYTNDSGDFAEVMRARIDELNARIEFLDIRVDRLNTLAQIDYFLLAAKDQQL